jgi:parallel beta-helix repeat protein
MRDTFWHPTAEPRAPARQPESTTGPQAAETESADPARVTARTEPPTHVVDAYQRGDFATIGAAIKRARPGDRIVVRPGLYQEGLVIDKPLEILGDGPVADIEIQARGADTMLFQATIGRIANLSLRQAGGEGKWYGVDITQGRLDLEGCDITSQSLACVAIHGGADPRLRRNTIHDGEQSGVHVYDQGLGTLEDNDITANAHAGVTIKTGGNPTLRRNRINRNGYEAVWIYQGGKGVVEDNDLTGNKRGAWDIAPDSQGSVTRARNREKDPGSLASGE